MHLKQNQIILNNITLPKFEKKVLLGKITYTFEYKQRPDEKRCDRRK